MVIAYKKKNRLLRFWGLIPMQAKKRIVAGILVILFFLLLVGALLLGIYSWLGKSEFFQITSIKIEGTERVDKEAIVSLSGVDIYANLLAVDLDAIKIRIESHAWIDSAFLKRQWPNRLIVRVKERKPLALLNTKNKLYFVDRKGDAFAVAGADSELDFPVITGLEDIDISSAKDDKRIDDALAFIRKAVRGSSSLPRQNISEFHFAADGEVELFLADRPFPVYLGKEISQNSYYRLAKVLYWLYKKREFDEVSFIRLDYTQDKVLVKKK